MKVLTRLDGLVFPARFANTVANEVRNGNGLAMPIDFFDIQVDVRIYSGDPLQKLCDDLELVCPGIETLDEWRAAQSLMFVVFPDRVLVYDELDASEITRLMDELKSARRHLFQAFRILGQLAPAA